MSKSHLSAPSLRQTEAEARHELLDVTSYDVRLDLASDPETFGSVTTIHFESRGGPTFVDLKSVRVNDLRFNDEPLDPTLLEEGRLPLHTLAGSNVLRVDAVMGFRNDGEGLHRSVDPADGRHYVYGMSFMDAAPSVFACFDQPDLKAPYTFHVTAPTDWTVIGNAPGEQVQPGTWEFAATQPLSTYFVTIVAGPYHVLRAEHDGIPLGLSARASLARELERDAEELFTMTGQCFDEYHRRFGIRYPFGDYHQAFVPEFNAGAMENPGCVTYRDPYLFPSRVTRGAMVLRATTVAHEMAHQWFGNIVTPKWWDDLWLNESFAEYLGNRVTADVTEYDDAMVHLSYQRRQWGLTSDQRPSTHPVAGNGAADALSALQDFDGISYVKGASILRQVNATIGDEVFFAGVVDHLTRHRFGNATMHDLFASWEHAGAGDLSAFTGEWLRVPGPDVIELDRGAAVLRRTPPPEHPADRPHRFTVAQADSGHWQRVEVTLTGPETPYDAGSAPVVVDPDEESWGVYVPDGTTLDGLVDLVPDLKDEALRAGVWNNVRSGFHHGTLDPTAVVDLLVASLPIEDTEDSARHLMPWVLGWVLPAAPPGSPERVHAAALAKVSQCGAGSELQLSAFRAAVHTCDDVSMLRGWLEQMPEGLDLDIDLRWRLLVRLATLGATDRSELDAALADEPTGQSRVEHTRAVASLPTAEGKAFAWERFVGTVDVPNYELEAAGRGMWRAGHQAVTEEYVERYFVDLPGTAEVRSGWMLGIATGAFFPATAVRQQVLDRAHAVLELPDLDRTIHRQLGDSADDLRRKLAIREAFRSDERGTPSGPSVRTRVQELTGSKAREHEDRLVTEEPLEIRLAWPGMSAHRVWVTMRTPGHDFELAAGWLRHEGIGSPSTVAYCTDEDLRPEQEFNVVTATLDEAPLRLPAARSAALSAGSSACGVCGSDSIEAALEVAAGARWAGEQVAPEVVRALPALLRDRQAVFDRTGGVHAAGLFDAAGAPLVVREDVGRHNAVDKVTGARVLAGAAPAEAALVVSGRAGFELVQKALAAGVGALVAVGAPTSLAVDLARRGGLALYGFTSQERTVRYP